MIAYCRNGKMDRIITKSISRLARNNLESCRVKWKALASGKDLLMVYKSRDFLKLTENTAYIDKVDMDFMIMVLDNITIYESGRIIIKFYDGTKIEYC